MGPDGHRVPLDATSCPPVRTFGEPRLDPVGRMLWFVESSADGAGFVSVDMGTGDWTRVPSEPAPRSTRPMGGSTYDWSVDGGYVCLVADGGLWRLPRSGGSAEPFWSAVGDLTGVSVASDGRVACVVDRRDVVVVDPDGTHVVVSNTADFAQDTTWSPDGRRLAWLAWDAPSMPWDDGRVVVAAPDKQADLAVVAGGRDSAAQQPRFGPDAGTLAVVDDRSGWLNVTLLDAATGEVMAALAEPFEHAGPPWGVGQRSYAWSPDGRSLAVCRNEGGFGALLHWRPGNEPETIGRGVHGGLTWRGSTVVAVRTGGRTPTGIVAYEPSGDGFQRRLVASSGGDEVPGVEPELVSWTGEDGAEVPGRLYRPLTGGAEPPPTIVWVHGGPTDQWQVEFRPRIVFWLTRGWAVLVPDHRGSTGHGRSFAQALAGRWGELDVADVVAGAEAAVARGWADPNRLVAMGSSAGGFTILNALAGRPGLFAAGVAAYPVSDLLDMGTDRFEAHYNESLVGPRPAAIDRYRSRSPVHRAADITAPLLLFHGTDDPVVPYRQSEVLAERLRSAGRTVELHRYEGEGHGWGRPEVVVDELQRTEGFLRRHVPTG